MGAKENLELADRIWRGVSDQDMRPLEEALADDCVQEWPQSGERIRGKANIMAVNENYPGLPNPTLRRAVAGDDLLVTEVQLDYGGKVYHAVSIFEIQDGKIVRETDYFAEPFEAPGWRAQWAERT
jgi:ketosteroid isomerase-like protein